jgi:hypothetical protein
MGDPLPQPVVELLSLLADPTRPAVERLRAADGLREALDAWLPTLAEAARAEEGQSWTTIGSALHITRQAAQQRFGGPRRKPAAEAWNTDPGHDANVSNRQRR